MCVFLRLFPPPFRLPFAAHSPRVFCVCMHDHLFYHHQFSFFIVAAPPNLCFYSFFILFSSIPYVYKFVVVVAASFFLLISLACSLVHLFISFHILFYCKFSRFLCLIDSLTLILIIDVNVMVLRVYKPVIDKPHLRNDIEHESGTETDRARARDREIHWRKFVFLNKGAIELKAVKISEIRSKKNAHTHCVCFGYNSKWFCLKHISSVSVFFGGNEEKTVHWHWTGWGEINGGKLNCNTIYMDWERKKLGISTNTRIGMEILIATIGLGTSHTRFVYVSHSSMEINTPQKFRTEKGEAQSECNTKNVLLFRIWWACKGHPIFLLRAAARSAIFSSSSLVFCFVVFTASPEFEDQKCF